MPRISKLWKAAKLWPVFNQLNRLRLRRIYRSKPFVINLELTTKCNARCRMCPHPESDFDKKALSLQGLDKVLDGLSGAVPTGTILYPVGLGEPLLVPDLYEMNQRIALRYPQARIHYNTNGILLGSPRSEAFLDFAHRVVISLNAPDRDKYQELMRVDRYVEVVAGIRGFLQRRDRHPRFRNEGFPRIEVQMMGLDAYADDFEGFVATWRPLLHDCDDVYFNPMDNWGGKIPDKQLYSRKPAKRYPCGSLWRMVSVDVDGNIFPCCVPFGTRNGKSIGLGNILAEPMPKLLRNGILDRIKRIHLEGKEETLEACRGCDVYRVDPNIRFRNPFAGNWI